MHRGIAAIVATVALCACREPNEGPALGGAGGMLAMPSGGMPSAGVMSLPSGGTGGTTIMSGGVSGSIA